VSTKLITPAVTLPVELALVKQHLRLEVEDLSEDVLLTQFIRAAEGICEQYQGRVYSKKTYRNFSDHIPSFVKLPFPPLAAVMDVKLKLQDGTELTIPSADYYVDTASFCGRMIMKDPWKYAGFEIEPSGFQITFESGYEKIPESYAQALLLVIGQFYENRENLSPVNLFEIPFGVKALLAADRVVNV